MKLTLCTLVLFALVVSALCDDEAWEEHKAKHHLKYKDEALEEEHKENFLSVLKLVEETDAKSKTRGNQGIIRVKVNELSHLSPSERTQGLFGLKPRPKRNGTRKLQNRVPGHPVDENWANWLNFPGEPRGNPKPAALDWMGMGKVNTPGYTQNPCGSCWAFSGAAVIESHHLIRYGKQIKLSEQFIRDCAFDKRYATSSSVPCQGAFLETAMQLASEAPIPSIQDYPYQLDDKLRQCPVGKAGFTLPITGIARVDGDDEMMAALRTVGPLVVAMDADEIAQSQQWFNWNGQNPSVYTAQRCTDQTNHAVTLIGYGTDPKYGPYWTIRNSWGPTWGYKGTFKVPRGRCGINYGVYPCFDNKCDHGKIILPLNG